MKTRDVNGLEAGGSSARSLMAQVQTDPVYRNGRATSSRLRFLPVQRAFPPSLQGWALIPRAKAHLGHAVADADHLVCRVQGIDAA